MVEKNVGVCPECGTSFSSSRSWTFCRHSEVYSTIFFPLLQLEKKYFELNLVPSEISNLETSGHSD